MMSKRGSLATPVAALVAVLLAAPAFAAQVTLNGNPLQLSGEPVAVGAEPRRISRPSTTISSPFP